MRPSKTPKDVKVLLPKLPVAGYTMVERSCPYGGEQSRRAIDLLIRRLELGGGRRKNTRSESQSGKTECNLIWSSLELQEAAGGFFWSNRTIGDDLLGLKEHTGVRKSSGAAKPKAAGQSLPQRCGR